MDRPRIVLGLGNPGTRYRETRHNLGFRVVDGVARRARVAFDLKAGAGGLAWTTEVEGPEGPVVLAKPRTYMNRAGRAALALCAHHGVSPGEVLVVYDDADLALGRLRLRPFGGAGGHNGMRSLMDAFRGEAFPRMRLGVCGTGRTAADLADYVLEPFEPDEEPVAARLADLAVEAVEAVVAHGVAAAMNEYNARSVEPGSGGGAEGEA